MHFAALQNRNPENKIQYSAEGLDKQKKALKTLCFQGFGAGNRT